MMEDHIQITFPVLRVRQPIGEFFIGAVRASDLFKICYFDIRQVELEKGFDSYLGIQRELSLPRVKEIQQYVQTQDATFPTAVILAVDQRCAILTKIDPRASIATNPDETEQHDAEVAFGEVDGNPSNANPAALKTQEALDQSRFLYLTLRNVPNPEDGESPVLFRQIARVLDGQHRIEGLANYRGPDFEVNVSIFVGISLPTQASVFSVVNLAQTKVNRSLVYDLYSYEKSRFPEKTCHDLAVGLDTAPSSPFFHKIKRLGVSERGKFGQTLSQATFVEALLPYLSENIIEDRDLGRRGKHYPPPTAKQLEKMIFRGMFVDGRDADIGKILWAFFSAVRNKWPVAWASTGSGLILNKTTGVQALMRFLRPAYLNFTEPGGVVSTEQFLKLFDKVELADDDFDTEHFKPGSSGTSRLYQKLMDDSDLSY